MLNDPAKISCKEVSMPTSYTLVQPLQVKSVSRVLIALAGYMNLTFAFSVACSQGSVIFLVLTNSDKGRSAPKKASGGV